MKLITEKQDNTETRICQPGVKKSNWHSIIDTQTHLKGSITASIDHHLLDQVKNERHLGLHQIVQQIVLGMKAADLGNKKDYMDFWIETFLKSVNKKQT